jgi:dolichol-phosphate mannosyltransferase
VTALLVAQGLALLILIGRLLPGRRRRPPVLPATDVGPPRVSVLLPTYNEAARLRPCLEGLLRQGTTVREIVVIDGNSTDDTERVVDGIAARDDRVRVVREPPLPGGWIGKVWALQQGLEHTRGDWVLNVDADIEPRAGLAAAAVRAAEELRLDVVSFSPCFAGQTAAEQWVQPSLLVTLIYRSGVAPATAVLPAHRVLANGQCFLARRRVLQAHGGYAAARASFSDDVTLARFLAGRGARVGFMDGSRLFKVRSYASLGEMWREWGRSVALADATAPWRLAADIAFLVLVQAAPLPLLLLHVAGILLLPPWAIAINAALVMVRVSMLAALAPAYERRRWTYWLSPAADVLAVTRLIVSSLRRPTSWRGRSYRELRTAGS